MSNARVATVSGAMRCDGEETNRDTVKRSPFLDAYLEFDQQMYKAFPARDELLVVLCSPVVDRNAVRDRAERLLDAWEAGERAAEQMAKAKQHREQALSEQTTRLLDENAEPTADALEQAAQQLVDDRLLGRVLQLRERAHLRRASIALEHGAPEQVQL